MKTNKTKERMNAVKLDTTPDGMIEIYANGYYLGSYSKTVANLKLRAWGLPEID